ncbi:MAG: hypothetical protein B7Z73_01690 [Planctomycetia bacterium 21-64-5]|nr:MAG: hypothetical protein B7Z73_01690 [Planctomycetia bacterium 21-64-5]
MWDGPLAGGVPLAEQAGDEDELLLEGSWPAGQQRTGRWSLDESIDARFAWIDRRAIELAETAAGGGPSDRPATSFPYINALSLRYYLVKLLRVPAFFEDVRTPTPGERIDLYLTTHRDEAYADLIQQLAQQCEATLEVHWHQPPARKAAKLRRPLPWRQWAERARRWPTAPPAEEGDGVPRVVLCGSPRILNPVCAELLARGCRVWWLYERFALRCWWRWRAAGVEQLVCEADDPLPRRFNDAWTGAELRSDGIDLAQSVERWLAERAADVGEQQSALIDRIEGHFRAVRPTALVLDEDATPLKRIAVALARRHGARSSVVQHGAPCGPFGFVPPAADEICVWGGSAQRQLETWGVAPSKIRVAGWPNLKPRLLELHPARPASQTRAKRFLLLATVEPRDERPDGVEFHLTSGNYALILQMVHEVLSQIEHATLTIKLHPRARKKEFIRFQRPVVETERPASAPATTFVFKQGRARNPLPVRVVHSKNLARLVAASDCVLSCASTAGIEAALAGAPVVQILPIGSGNVLPADDWGFVGTARTAGELAALVDAALERGWGKPAETADRVLAKAGAAAARSIVDGLIAASDAQALLLGSSR